MKASFIFIFSLLITNTYLVAQIYPVTLNERVEKSTTIAIVKVNEKLAYWDQDRANIYTLNVLEVIAYLKGQSTQSEIAMITEGGQVGSDMHQSFPETKLRTGKRYLVFLDEENLRIDHKNYRFENPNIRQCKAIARIQGAMLFQDGKYRDALVEAPQSEAELIAKIENMLGEKPKTPEGRLYTAMPDVPEQESGGRDPFVITSVENGFGTMAPGPFVGGTIVTGEELVIKAAAGGFGATQGTGKVEFANADDGGATMIEPPNASDYVSWSDTEIRVKIPSDAATGDIKVTDGAGSTDTWDDVIDAGFTVKWAMNAVDSDFYLWGADNRNRVELVEDNGSGGYTFEYSTVGGMATNTDAKDAFERALTTWRCETFVNFDVSPTSTGVGHASDGVNVVMFASLSGSTLGVMTSRYSANGTGLCDMEDTFWRLNELDCRFDSGTTWYYGSGACTGSKYDFESVAVHEIGHGHGLGHINDVTKIMHYSIGNCVIMHDPHVDEVEAGDHKMDHSETANCLGPPSYPDVMTAVTPAACSLLPVELFSFTGRLANKFVELNWETATEIDNDYFTLERSSDGRNFVAIATVRGSGTSFENQFYHYLDKFPATGTNYYRLSQTDFDGTKVTQEKIVSVNFAGESDLEIRPNPVSENQFRLTYHASQNGELGVEIYSVTGALLYRDIFEVNRERNDIDISLPDLSNGVYILKTKQKNTTHNLRFVKTGS